MRLLVAFLFGLLWAHTGALKQELTLFKDDRDAVIIETFGFKEDGIAKIELEHLKVSGEEHTDRKPQLAFVLKKMDTLDELNKELNKLKEKKLCLVDKLEPEDYILDVSSPDVWSEGVLHTFFMDKLHTGLYTLLFIKCHHKTDLVSMQVRTEMRNDGPSFLGSGEEEMPLVYFTTFLVFFLAFVSWLLMLLMHKESIQKFNLLLVFSTVLLAKSLSALFHGLRYSQLEEDGEADETVDGLFFGMHFVKDCLLFSLLALIASGLSILKPFLTSKEKALLILVLCIQILSNTCLIFIDETSQGSSSWEKERIAWYLLDMLGCVLVFVPVSSIISHLEGMLRSESKEEDEGDVEKSSRRSFHNRQGNQEEEEEGDGLVVTSQAVAFVRLFRSFYAMLIVWIYITRVGIYVLDFILPYDYVFVAALFGQAVDAVFFGFVGHMLFKTSSVSFSRGQYQRLKAGSDDEGSSYTDKYGDRRRMKEDAEVEIEFKTF